MRWLMLFTLLLVACWQPPADPILPLPSAATMPVRVSTDFEPFFKCSGVAIHPGFALTAQHCVDDAMWVDGNRVKDSVAPNPAWDMAVLHVPGLKSGDVQWAEHKPHVGDQSILVGWGCSKFHTEAKVSTGTVLSIDERDLTYDTKVCGGDSGGPVYDVEGHLIGLIVRMVAHSHQAVVQYLAE